MYLYHDNYLNVFWQEKGVDLIKIHANQPDKYALALCDALFEDSELAESCYKSTKRSTKPPLTQNGLHSWRYTDMYINPYVLNHSHNAYLYSIVILGSRK